MLKPKSFDVCKNAIVLIIAMLGYSEINTEISGTGMETAKSNNCRKVLKDNRNANGVLAMI